MIHNFFLNKYKSIIEMFLPKNNIQWNLINYKLYQLIIHIYILLSQCSKHSYDTHQVVFPSTHPQHQHPYG